MTRHYCTSLRCVFFLFSVCLEGESLESQLTDEVGSLHEARDTPASPSWPKTENMPYSFRYILLLVAISSSGMCMSCLSGASPRHSRFSRILHPRGPLRSCVTCEAASYNTPEFSVHKLAASCGWVVLISSHSILIRRAGPYRCYLCTVNFSTAAERLTGAQE